MEHVTQMAVARPFPPHSLFPPDTLHEQQTFPWFALCVRQRQREQCENYLSGNNYHFFSPTRRELREWSDRKKSISVPLFPGYIFCRFDPRVSLPILQSPGVIDIINAGGRYLEVDAVEIDSVSKSLSSGYDIEVVPSLVTGQRVRIISGPMTGVEGILTTIKQQLKVGLQIAMMNRTVLVEIHSSQVIAV